MKRHVVVLLREVLKLNQKDFADVVDCSESTLQAVERGPERLKMSNDLAEKIFLQTGVSMDWLLANDFEAPMVEGINGGPYTKEIYDQIQSVKPVEGSETFGDRARLLRLIEKLFWSFLAGEKTSVQAAALVGYRFHCFVEELGATFGAEKFSWSPEGQESWDRVYKAMKVYLHEANPLPVLFADGTEAVVHPGERITPEELKRRVRTGTRHKKVKTS